jgi:hypothetical protein
LPASVDSRADTHGPFPVAGSRESQARKDHAPSLSPHAAALRRALQGHQQTTPPWLISYADLITLLLCFFILLTGASRTEQHRLEPVLASLADQFSGAVDRGAETDGSGARSVGELRLVKERMQSLIANAMPLAVTRRSSEADRLEVELPESGLFQEGADDLNALGRSRLRHLLAAIRQAAGVTPYRLEYRVSWTDAAPHRAAVLGSETMAAGRNVAGVGVAVDNVVPAGTLWLRIELGGKAEESTAS